MHAALLSGAMDRPKTTDTEDDLLAFQSSFLCSGERPSASLKRKIEEPSSSSVDARDVVRLNDEGSYLCAQP